MFFKQIKQTLKLHNFLGHNANAVEWQIWSALLTYILLPYEAFLSGWTHSFTRLLAMIRGVLWDRIDLLALLDFHGTAGGRFRMYQPPNQLHLPGFASN